MATELKTFTIEMKSLDQAIDSPVIAGSGDVNGCKLRVVFTQRAACEVPRNAKVYLNWMHRELKVRGYNVFDKVSDKPQAWEIHWPKAMLHEGSVLCRIEVVDDVSIAPSNNFTVHVLQNPNDGSSFVASDDFSEFQQAIIDMTRVSEEMRQELQFEKDRFDSLAESMEQVKSDAEDSLTKVDDALAKVDDALANLDDATVSPDEVKEMIKEVVGESPDGQTAMDVVETVRKQVDEVTKYVESIVTIEEF